MSASSDFLWRESLLWKTLDVRSKVKVKSSLGALRDAPIDAYHHAGEAPRKLLPYVSRAMTYDLTASLTSLIAVAACIFKHLTCFADVYARFAPCAPCSGSWYHCLTKRRSPCISRFASQALSVLWPFSGYTLVREDAAALRIRQCLSCAGRAFCFAVRQERMQRLYDLITGASELARSGIGRSCTQSFLARPSQ